MGVTRLWRTIRLGLKSLWLHRLRSLLTVLGIVFGVCSVIAMLAIGEGASYEAQEQIRSLGSNNIIIRSVKPPDEKKTSSTTTYMVEYGLTYADISRIRATIPNVTVMVPGRVIRTDVWNAKQRVDCEIVGTVPWYPIINNHRVERGRFISELEMQAVSNVCVLGHDMARQLFPIDEPMGKTVRVGSDYYKVIGVMELKSHRAVAGTSNGNGGGDKGSGQTPQASPADSSPATDRMFIPLTAARRRFGEILIKSSSGSRAAERVELHEATVKVDSPEHVVESSLIISELLKRNHKKKDYELVVPLELLRQAERTKRIFSVVLGAIAAISLIVGGIGIMNIMLASVTERTREIGIRRALGAKRRDIVLQFLIETVLLSGVGGVIGVGLGLAIPFFITYFAEMKTIVTFWSPLIAFSISGLVGVIFGIYPALRAADMDPVEALRHE
ncbi:MAG: ABC transporter permease [Candidatus Hydrogenedentes bacterium]|nr:ABC transporter permease [Candidatus Hydrogenedentota bacterium]